MQLLYLDTYGTLGQNKMGDVAAICAHKNKRTSPEISSLLNKAHRALLTILAKNCKNNSFVVETAQIATTSPYLSSRYRVMESLLETLYRH